MRRPAEPGARSQRLRRVLAAVLVLAHTASPAQDTPEMLAAMGRALPPVPAEVPARDALPAALRQQLPPLRIELHRWHADPAERFVRIDGRRIAEGGVAGQELWVRQIRVEGVVLQFRDRFFLQPR